MHFQKYGPLCALFMAMMLWGSAFVAFKFAITAYDPFVVVFCRLTLSAVIFWFLRRWWWPQRIVRTDVPLLGFMALCEPCLYFVFEGQALRWTSASQAGTVAATLPVLVAIGAWLFLGEKVGLRAWFGLLVALVGVVAISLCGIETEASPYPAWGNFLELLAMVCAAGYTISVKKLSSGYSPWFLTAVQSGLGGLFFLPLVFLPSTNMPTECNAEAFGAVVYLGLGTTFGAYGLYNYGVSQLPAWQASAFTNLIPVFSIVLGWWILGETLTMAQFLGAGAVLCGVVFSQKLPPAPPVPATRSSNGVNPRLAICPGAGPSCSQHGDRRRLHVAFVQPAVPRDDQSGAGR